MFDLKRKLVAVAMAVTMSCLLSVGALAQKRGENQRPPKQDNTKVVVKEKDPRPPQNNNTQQPRNDDKKGKPLN